MPSFNINLFFKQFLYDPANPLLFNNGFFVLFFGVFMVLYYYFRNNYKIRRYIFCFFSLYFFYKASGYFVGFVLISAVVDFVLSNAIYRQQKQPVKKALLLLSIVFNLGLLCYFKYTNFFIDLSNNILSTQFHPLNVLLPIGISFYTFENLSYTIDVYRGHFKPASKFSDYLLFLSFFPKLVMGPIVRAHDFVPQVNQPFELSENDFTKGFYLILSGMFKKLIISDFITLNFVNYVFDDPSRYTGLENLLAIYGYAVVIYCDFSGYSDVAIGLAKWLGFHIPPNFLSPYQSTSITEFWRRWHMSLSTWLRDYLYIPLGGNKNASIATYLLAALFFTGVFFFGLKVLHWPYGSSLLLCFALLLILFIPYIFTKERRTVSTNLNLFGTMLLGGFWHGASFNFIIWGALHGIGLAIHKIWMMFTNLPLAGMRPKRWYRIVSALITFNFVCFCWVFFRAPDFDTASNMLYQVFHNFSFDVWGALYANYKKVFWMMALAFALHLIPDDFVEKMIKRNGNARVPMAAYVLVFFLFVLLYGFFKTSEQVLPIYLKF